MVYSAYSSPTLPPVAASSGEGAGGGGKQFAITRCLGRLLWPCREPFVVPLDGAGVRASAPAHPPVGKVEQGREKASESSGVVTPDVARDDAGVKISRRKKNLAWLTASRCCARRMFSSTCVPPGSMSGALRTATSTDVPTLEMGM